MRWPQAVTCLPGAAEVASCSSGPEGGAGSQHAPVSLARGSRGAVRRCGDSRGPRSRFCRTVCASAPEWVPGQWRPSCPLTEAGREAHGVSRGACPPSEPGAPRPMFQCVVCFGTRPDSFCALVVVATAVPMEGSRDKDVVTGCWVTASPSWRSVCPASRSSLPRPDLRAQRQGPTLSATFFAFEVGHMQSCF